MARTTVRTAAFAPSTSFRMYSTSSNSGKAKSPSSFSFFRLAAFVTAARTRGLAKTLRPSRPRPEGRHLQVDLANRLDHDTDEEARHPSRRDPGQDPLRV